VWLTRNGQKGLGVESASSTSARVGIKGVLGNGSGRVGEVGTGGRFGGSESEVACGGFGLLVGWRVGDIRSVIVVVICTGQKSSSEGASRVSSGVAFWPHRDHGCQEHVSRNLWLCVNAECGWLARGGQVPHSEQSGPGPSPVQRGMPSISLPSISFPFVAAIYLTHHTFQRAPSPLSLSSTLVVEGKSTWTLKHPSQLTCEYLHS